MSRQKGKYYPHIDGLRAVAVLLVFLFHLAPETFPAGYLGVDIFFVISGFVITQTLFQRYQETGQLQLMDFYRRRFKRLYPPLIVMVLLTGLLYILIGFVWDANHFIKSSLTTLLAISNFYYLKQGENYFHQDLINPLLHTWSLGIEEQFYLLYPFLLLALITVFARSAVRHWQFALALLVLAIISFLTFRLGGDDLWGNYYFPLARFWELLAGCSLYFFSQSYTTGRLSEGLAWAALLLLAVVQFSYFSDSVHIETLLTVLASATLIFVGLQHVPTFSRMLSWQPLVYVGLISYSLYLWHLPVIYFLNLYLSEFWYLLLALPITVVCAAASYHLIEQRTRYAAWLDRWFYGLLYGGAATAVVLVLLVGFTSPTAVITGVNNQLNQAEESIGRFNYIERQYQLADRVQTDYFLNGISTATHCSEDTADPPRNDWGIWEKCLKQKDGERLLYLTGDSHASHFVPMVDASRVVDDVYYTRFSRRALVNIDGAELETEKNINDRAVELERLSEHYEDIIYVSSFHFTPSLPKLAALKENLQTYIEVLSPHATLVFIGPTPLFPNSPQSCVILGVHCEIDRDADMAAQQGFFSLLEEMASQYDNLYVYNPYDEICPGIQCRLYDNDSQRLIYLDDDHLSSEMSAALAPHFDAWLQANNLN